VFLFSPGWRPPVFPHAAIEKDLRVAWFTLESLTAAIARAKADGSVARTVARICRSDLIVVDDIGMLPAGQDAAEAFYRITDAAYERRSVAVTSNIHPSGFDTIMPKTLATATATVDRLLHHAHLVLIRRRRYQVACATPAARQAARVPILGASRAIASSVTASTRARCPRPRRSFLPATHARGMRHERAWRGLDLLGRIEEQVLRTGHEQHRQVGVED
jgi:hypothetical protein